MTTKELIRAEIERRKNKAETIRERGAYLELLSFLDTLPDESEQPARGYDEAYLNEKIAKASKSWKGVDVDKFMDEIRGREPVTDCHKLSIEEESSKQGEVWKEIAGYEGFYKVSNKGRILSLPHMRPNGRNSYYVTKERIKSSTYDKHGYKQVRLHKDGVGVTRKVHRLVADAFIPNPNNLPEINHKDEIKDNNVVDNLEWCNRNYNMQYGKNTHLGRKPVAQYSLDGALIMEFESIDAASKATGIHSTNIGKCAKRRAKTAGGFIWKLI